MLSSPPAVFSISLFHRSSHLSRLASLAFAPVKPKSSHNHPVTRPRIPSTIFRGLYGLYIGTSSEFSLSMTRRNSTSDRPAGSRISGYMFENVGARSPSSNQSRFILIIRVFTYSGESTGTWGFRCGKHGCCGPHSSSSACSSGSPRMDELLDEMADPIPSLIEPAESRRSWSSGPRSRSRSKDVDCCCSFSSLAVMTAFPLPLSSFWMLDWELNSVTVTCGLIRSSRRLSLGSAPGCATSTSCTARDGLVDGPASTSSPDSSGNVGEGVSVPLLFRFSSYECLTDRGRLTVSPPI